MKLLIFVNTKNWTGNNPFEIERTASDLSREFDVERYGRGWADSFNEDLVMIVEEEE